MDLEETQVASYQENLRCARKETGMLIIRCLYACYRGVLFWLDLMAEVSVSLLFFFFKVSK